MSICDITRHGYKKPTKISEILHLVGFFYPWPVISQIDILLVVDFLPTKSNYVGIWYNHLIMQKYLHICTYSFYNKNTKSNALYVVGIPMTSTNLKCDVTSCHRKVFKFIIYLHI